MQTLTAGALCLGVALVAGCSRKPTPGVAASAASSAEPAPGGALVEAFGARFTLPKGYAGAESDAGGWEFTDGERVVLVGRHPVSPEASVDSIAAERESALASLGEATVTKRDVLRVAGHDVRTATGSGGGVRFRLLVARLDGAAALSILLVGDSEQPETLEAAWKQVLATLQLP